MVQESSSCTDRTWHIQVVWAPPREQRLQDLQGRSEQPVLGTCQPHYTVSQGDQIHKCITGMIFFVSFCNCSDFSPVLSWPHHTKHITPSKYQSQCELERKFTRCYKLFNLFNYLDWVYLTPYSRKCFICRIYHGLYCSSSHIALEINLKFPCIRTVFQRRAMICTHTCEGEGRHSTMDLSSLGDRKGAQWFEKGTWTGMSGVQAQDALWPPREKCAAASQPFPGSVWDALLLIRSGFTNLLKHQTLACRETALNVQPCYCLFFPCQIPN